MLSWPLHACGRRSNRFKLQTMRVDDLFTDLAIVGAARPTFPTWGAKPRSRSQSRCRSLGQAQSSDNTPTWS